MHCACFMVSTGPLPDKCYRQWVDPELFIILLLLKYNIIINIIIIYYCDCLYWSAQLM